MSFVGLFSLVSDLQRISKQVFFPEQQTPMKAWKIIFSPPKKISSTHKSVVLNRSAVRYSQPPVINFIDFKPILASRGAAKF